MFSRPKLTRHRLSHKTCSRILPFQGTSDFLQKFLAVNAFWEISGKYFFSFCLVFSATLLEKYSAFSKFLVVSTKWRACWGVRLSLRSQGSSSKYVLNFTYLSKGENSAIYWKNRRKFWLSRPMNMPPTPNGISM